MGKKLMKNYPLGIAKPMPTKVTRSRVTTVDGQQRHFSSQLPGAYAEEAYRPNSMINDRPREPH